MEAGGDDEPCTYQVPVLHGFATEDPDMRLDHYVLHYADQFRQQRDPKYQRERAKGRNGVYYPRARTLGGCTAHYAMIIVRPHDSDWQEIWDVTGDASWAPREMDKYFSRVEKCLYRSDSTGGHGQGWLPVSFPDPVQLGRQAIDHHDNLRVVDASVFPKIPGFFVVMPIYMIAEKASDVILADAAR